MGEVVYNKLDERTNQIRVVGLLPGRWIDKISCEIKTISLDDSPSYEALSYVWGNAQDTVEILVDGLSVQVTRNLAAALRRLRSSLNPRTLWADAICINQDDLEERTQQVGIMHKIYEIASSVRVFLGESGILDIIPAEEQATWDDPPCTYWHRDNTWLMCAENPVGLTFARKILNQGNKNGVEEVTAADYDPRKSPMWAVVSLVPSIIRFLYRTNQLKLEPEGIRDQARVDAFFARQTRAEYDPSKLTVVEAFRDSQAGAFAIMNMLSNGRCLKACLQSDSLSPVWTKALDVIDHIVKLPWWTRIWVLQEAILPQGQVFAIYGEIVAPLGLIEDSGSVLQRHYQKRECCKAFFDTLPPGQQDILDRFTKAMSGIEGIREIWAMIREDQLTMLGHYLHKTRYNDATDLRDKIYGLLGLVRGCPNPLDLVPDYNSHVFQVYTNLAIRIIHHERSLLTILNHEIRI